MSLRWKREGTINDLRFRDHSWGWTRFLGWSEKGSATANGWRTLAYEFSDQMKELQAARNPGKQKEFRVDSPEPIQGTIPATRIGGKTGTSSDFSPVSTMTWTYILPETLAHGAKECIQETHAGSGVLEWGPCKPR